MDFDEDPNYLDLDDISAHAQRIGCKFLMDIPGLEFLSPGNSQDITQSTDLVLPFWMGKTLYAYSMIDIELPKQYNSNFRDILSADADVVDLHRAGPHYYKFGTLLVRLRRLKGNNLEQYSDESQRRKFQRLEGEIFMDPAENRQMAISLINTFHHRIRKILEYSTNPAADEDHRDVKTFKSRLDNLEKRIFYIGRQQVIETNKWKSRKIELINNNLLVARITKRRKLESALAHK